MGMSKHGLGIAGSPALSICPCPSVIQQLFTDLLGYSEQKKSPNDIKPFETIFVKGLHYADHPEFKCLAGTAVNSYVKIDYFTGRILDSYVKVKGLVTKENHHISFSDIRAFADLDASIKNSNSEQFQITDEQYTALNWCLKWHINLVHITREYLKGGWLERESRKKVLKEVYNKRVYLNSYGLVDLANKTKPEKPEDIVYEQNENG